jgi:hypothetical protein
MINGLWDYCLVAEKRMLGDFLARPDSMRFNLNQ